MLFLAVMQPTHTHTCVTQCVKAVKTYSMFVHKTMWKRKCVSMVERKKKEIATQNTNAKYEIWKIITFHWTHNAVALSHADFFQCAQQCFLRVVISFILFARPDPFSPRKNAIVRNLQKDTVFMAHITELYTLRVRLCDFIECVLFVILRRTRHSKDNCM